MVLFEACLVWLAGYMMDIGSSIMLYEQNKRKFMQKEINSEIRKMIKQRKSLWFYCVSEQYVVCLIVSVTAGALVVTGLGLPSGLTLVIGPLFVGFEHVIASFGNFFSFWRAKKCI